MRVLLIIFSFISYLLKNTAGSQIMSDGVPPPSVGTPEETEALFQEHEDLPQGHLLCLGCPNCSYDKCLV